MKRVYQITGVVLLLLSIYVVIEGTGLKYYTSLGPGPGFFPIWLGFSLGILSVIMIFTATFRPQEPLPADFFAQKRGYLRAGAVIVSLIWIVVMMPVIGFRLSMAALLVCLQLSLGRVNPIIMLVVTAAGSWGAFWLFDTFLRVPLPVGLFGF